MSAQHTPGPWNYVQMGTQIWASSVGGCRMEKANHLIADVRGWGHLQYLPNGAEVQDANGFLIAASPDLLEALKLADRLLSGANMNRTVVERTVRAAIAKATGATE